MKFAGIVLFCIGAAMFYGIVHDQITARICLEYFTVAHPRLISSESPTVLGLFWGVVATWWVGLGLGLLLAVASRAGRWPKLAWADHRAGVLRLLGVMAILASLAGLGSWLVTRNSDPVHLSDLTGERISPHVRSRFLAAWAAHLTSYAAGFVGGLLLVVTTALRRSRMSKKCRLPA